MIIKLLTNISYIAYLHNLSYIDSTDGCRNMSGINKGLDGRTNAKVMEERQEASMIFHCTIHQEALCCRVLAREDVMDVVVPTVNYIHKNALVHRQFKKFLEDFDSEYGMSYILPKQGGLVNVRF